MPGSFAEYCTIPFFANGKIRNNFREAAWLEQGFHICSLYCLPSYNSSVIINPSVHPNPCGQMTLCQGWFQVLDM